MDHETHDSDEPDAGIDIQALVEVASHEIAEQARRHPVRTLGIAFGVGYVLGGGLPRFMVKLAGAALLRTAGNAMLDRLPWTELVGGAMGGAPGPDDTESTPSNGHARRSSPAR